MYASIRGTCCAIFVLGALAVELGLAAPLPREAKEAFQREMRSTAGAQRVAAVEKMSAYADAEGARLLMLLALGDSAPEVRHAARKVLIGFKHEAAIGKKLLADVRTELGKGAKGNAQAAHEAIQALCEYDAADIQTGLLSLLDERKSATPLPQLLKSRPVTQTALPAADALLAAIDRWAVDRDPAKIPLLARFAASEHFAKHYGLRKGIVDALIALHDPKAVTVLVDTLPANTGRTRKVVERYLAKATGQAFGGDAAKWKSWLAENPAAKLANVTELPSLDQNGTYYEIPIQAQRVAFVLDTSDSMKAGEKGVTRMDAAKKALIDTLSNLDSGVEFNIIAFHDGVTVWKRGLVPAEAKQKAEAIKFVQQMKALGKTATYDGLQAAFECDPNLEAIFCVSDGEPSTGKVVDPVQILADVKLLNRVRRVEVHAIGVFGGEQYKSLVEFMQALAEQNGGQFKRVD